MKKLCAIGEALIDFIPSEKGKRLKDVNSYRRVAGGAPSNVAGVFSRLGGESKLLTKLGNDAFGDYIISCLERVQINTDGIIRTDDYDTSLAFVSLAEDGNRDFKFYRRTAADLQYSPNDIKDDVIHDCGAIHFCSVSLVESPMRHAHEKLIQKALHEQKLISFDPNLRLSLWNDDEGLKKTVQAFLPFADIVKIADEELNFITGYNKITDALPSLFHDRCQIVIYTKGKDGASLYLKDGREYHMDGLLVDVVDTTGAGDSFIGAMLYRIVKYETNDLCLIEDDYWQTSLTLANAYAACTTTKQGALDALADKAEFKTFLKQFHLEDIL